MATFSDYMENPHWKAMYAFSINQKPYGVCCLNPSPGYSSLPLQTDGNVSVYFTRGRTSRFPYHGTDYSLTPDQQAKVRQCLAEQGNLYGCVQQYRENHNPKC